MVVIYFILLFNPRKPPNPMSSPHTGARYTVSGSVLVPVLWKRGKGEGIFLNLRPRDRPRGGSNLGWQGGSRTSSPSGLGLTFRSFAPSLNSEKFGIYDCNIQRFNWKHCWVFSLTKIAISINTEEYKKDSCSYFKERPRYREIVRVQKDIENSFI